MSKSMKTQLDMDTIATALGAKRGGRVTAGGGYFGAMELLAEVQARFQAPPGGGRRTDPTWTERRLLPLSRHTLRRLEQITARARKRDSLIVGPMQVAALLLEKVTEKLSVDQAEQLVRPRRLGRMRPVARVRGNRTVADLVRENRD